MPDDQRRDDLLPDHHIAPSNDATALPPSIAPTASPPPNHTPTLSPRQIGPYHILEPLGDGGMGTVYKAEQRHPIKRIVALKVIKPGFDTTEVIARFESERQALARMDHPHIARVLDAGTTDLGRPYFVMEYVPGIPITTFADQQTLTIRQRLELFVQVCQAIAHAHSKALIHRDIKPGNVLAYLSDGQPRAMVIDFGIAKALSGEKLVEATLTAGSGIAIGTPYSMSPEQAEGSPDIDTRTDVYSLGVLLYELLTGRKPFEPRDLARLALSEVLRIIREVDPPRPSDAVTSSAKATTTLTGSRNTHTLSRQLRAELEWIPMKAMRKERNRRYASPLTLAEDVENYLAGRPLAAGPESRIYRLKKFSKRNRTALTTAALFAALLIGGTLFYIQSIRAEQQRTQIALIERDAQATLAAQRADAEAQARKQAENSAAEANAVARFQTDMLATADPDQLLGDKVTVLQAMQAAVKELDSGKLKDRPLVEAAVRDTIGNTLRALARYDDAEPNLRRALDIRRQSLTAGHPDIGTSLNNFALLLQVQQRLAEAEPLYRESLSIRRTALPAGHTDIAQSLNDLALLLQAQNRIAEAERLFREALAIYRQSLPTGHRDIATSLNNLANLLQLQNKLAEAEPLLREALAIRRATLPTGHPAIAKSLDSLARLLQIENKPAEAELLFREALEIHRAALPAGHPFIATSLNNLASVLIDQNKLAEAEQLHRQALEIRRKALPAGHTDIADSLNNLATLLQTQDKLTEAEPLYLQALEIYRAALPSGHPLVARCLNNLAALLQAQSKFAEAEPLHREALEIRRNALPAGHPDIAASLNHLASVLQDQNKLAEAELLYRESLEISRTLIPAGHPDIAIAVSNLASLLQDQNKLADAEPLYREALEMFRKALPAHDPLVVLSIDYLASVLRVQNKLVEAEPLYRELLGIHRQSLPPDHPDIANTLSGLALCLKDTRRPAEAEPLSREALTIREKSFGPTHTLTCRTAFYLAEILDAQNKPVEAAAIRTQYRLGDPTTRPTTQPAP